MEPTQEPLVVQFVARVIAVNEKKYKQWLGGVGKEATFNEISLGWFVSLEGSHESLFIGFLKPSIRIGSMAIITIEYPRG